MKRTGFIRMSILFLLMAATILSSCTMESFRFIEYQGKTVTRIDLRDSFRVTVSGLGNYYSDGHTSINIKIRNKYRRPLTLFKDSIRISSYDDSLKVGKDTAVPGNYFEIGNVEHTTDERKHTATKNIYIHFNLSRENYRDSVYLAPTDFLLLDGERLFEDTLKIFVRNFIRPLSEVKRKH